MKKAKHEEICPHCEMPFRTIKGKFCSSNCRISHWRKQKKNGKILEKTYCPTCGNQLLSPGYKKFCNKNCRKVFYRNIRREETILSKGNCLICDNKLPLKHTKFCSDFCRDYFFDRKASGREVKIKIDAKTFIQTRKYDQLDMIKKRLRSDNNQLHKGLKNNQNEDGELNDFEG